MASGRKFSLDRFQKQEDMKRYFQVDPGKIHSFTNNISPPMGKGGFAWQINIGHDWSLSLSLTDFTFYIFLTVSRTYSESCRN